MGKREELLKLPVFSRNRLKYSINEGFFDSWNSQMAYVLGFTYADGNIYKTSLAWDLQTRDVDILEKFKKALNCTYPIIRRKKSVRLRISNQVLVDGAKAKGMWPKKNMRNEFPSIPVELVRHFIRGYLDGDGWVVLRNGRNEGDIGFAGGNKIFLELVNNIIKDNLNIDSGKVREKKKVTPKGVTSVVYQLEFYSSSAFKFGKWVYENLSTDDIFLDRKYKKYLEMKKLYEFLQSGNRKVRLVQKNIGRSMKDILNELYCKEKLNGKMIAEILGVHSSSIYRWLAQTGIKYSERKVVRYG